MNRPTRASGHDLREARELQITDPSYPVRLLALPDPPSPLFVAGTLDSHDALSVAIVGSRRASPEECQEAFELGRDLAEYGLTVVSGLALGVDAAAHRGALAVPGGRTIAVVATGLDRTFPPENQDLDRLIRTRGAVVSQFPPHSGPARERFLARNGVVAALSLAIVVVASDEYSGTRNTINHALSLGRPVAFWVPTMQNDRWAQRLASETRSHFVGNAAEVLHLTGRTVGQSAGPASH